MPSADAVEGESMQMSLTKCLILVRAVGAAMALATLLASTAPSHAADLAGSEWRPTVIGNKVVPKHAEIFVRFEAKGRLTGNGGCNGFFGSYHISSNNLEIGPLGATRMACPEPVLDREGTFMKALQLAKSFKRDGINLELIDEGGTVVMKLAQHDPD